MTLPIYIQLQNAELSQKYQELITNLDTCAMWKVELEREKIVKVLTAIYSEHGKDQLDSIHKEI